MSSAPASRAEIFGWAMYDFANSSYTTVIVTVVYAVVFPRLIVGDGPDFALGNLLWSVTLAASYGLVVLTLPVLGALMDQVGRKKTFLLASTWVTVGATAALGLAPPGSVALAMALVIVSNWAFSVGESFVASFLPELAPPDRLGTISGIAWGFGYVGGLVSTAIVLFGLGPAELENWSRLRFIGPVTAAFFLIAALPTFLLLKDRSQPRPVEGSPWTAGFRQIAETAREARRYRDLMVFFLSYFFAMAGLSVIIAFAFVYGDQVVRWRPMTQQAMFVLTQIAATVGALLFRGLQGRIGDKATYMLTLLVWLIAVGAIWGTEPLTDALRGAGLAVDAEQVFLGVGAIAGLCLGATQSAGRTLVALFSPPERTGEFFALWGVFGKLAAVVGLLAVGLLQSWFGLSNAVLICGLFFASAFVIAGFVDATRGRNVASQVRTDSGSLVR